MTDPGSISDAFHAHFQIVPAHSKALRDTAYRIRYRVYCEELGFEDKRNFPDGRETDDFDRHSEHCLLLHRETERYVGCVRLVLPDPQNPQRLLPFEDACDRALDPTVAEFARKSRGSFGEISRLAVLPLARPHRKDEEPAGISVPGTPGPAVRSSRRTTSRQKWRSDSRREFMHTGLGLYLAGAAMVMTLGLRSCFAMMEPRLARRLRHYGIHFQPVGDIVDYHGLRGPFQITPEGLLAELCPGFRDLLDNLLDDLRRSNSFEKAAS